MVLRLFADERSQRESRAAEQDERKHDRGDSDTSRVPHLRRCDGGQPPDQYSDRVADEAAPERTTHASSQASKALTVDQQRHGHSEDSGQQDRAFEKAQRLTSSPWGRAISRRRSTAESAGRCPWHRKAESSCRRRSRRNGAFRETRRRESRSTALHQCGLPPSPRWSPDRRIAPSSVPCPV